MLRQNDPFFWGIFLLLLIPALASGQSIETDTAKVNKVLIDHADYSEYTISNKKAIWKLFGSVALRQDSVYVYCDTAIVIDSTQVIAKGNVIIQQGDSVNVFSDSLFYDGLLKKAYLTGEVVLENGAQRLFTQRLDYDLQSKVATYFSGATLTDEQTQLSSLKGYYYVKTREAFFKDSVVVVDPEFNLRADTLQFNLESRLVTFLGPTLISSDSSRIYCESGFYDTRNEMAEFSQNPQFLKGTQKAWADLIRYNGREEEYALLGEAYFEDGSRKATADTIRYNESQDVTTLVGNAHFIDEKQDIRAGQIRYDAKKKTYATRGRSRVSDPPQILEADQIDYGEESGLGVALGNVMWQDTSANLTIKCAQVDYDQQTEYLKASGGDSGRPLLITLIDEDSLFLTSDTLLSVRTDTLQEDSTRLLIAYRDVRIYKSDLQAICDSLVYNTTDSLFRFFERPIVWSDTSQFMADTVSMFLADKKLDRIFLNQDAFIVNSADEIFFNQIKGKDITAFFDQDELRRMDVQGNAESVYYAMDEEGAYIGVNKTICSEMLLFFGNNQVDKIRFSAEPKAVLYPIQQADHDQLKLEGFKWEKKLRPTGIESLFAVLQTETDHE